MASYPSFRAYRRAVVEDIVAHTRGPDLATRRRQFGAFVFLHRAAVLRGWRLGFTPRETGLAVFEEAVRSAPSLFSEIGTVH